MIEFAVGQTYVLKKEPFFSTGKRKGKTVTVVERLDEKGELFLAFVDGAVSWPVSELEI